MRSPQAHSEGMDDKGLTPTSAANSWTRIEAYLAPMRRAGGRLRRLDPRSEPESPKVMLTTLPFGALLLGFLILSVAIAIAAWPPSQPDLPVASPIVHDLGSAPKGWFQKAQRQFHPQ